MLIMAVESSCDETAVAIVRDGRQVLADEIFSQVDIHALYGGVVPEIASRNHIEHIGRLASSALKKACISVSDIDAVGVTYAPGLIGAVLVGVNFAKAVAFALNKPLVPVHHIRGHIAANYIAYPDLVPPFLCLVISGGHSLIIDVNGYTDMKVIGSTRDDAAGECFDKSARVLGLGYPGGALLDKLSKNGNKNRYKLPRAKVDSSEFDMSFSGLKTAVVNLVHNAQQKGEQIDASSLAASLAAAVSDTLVPRTMLAAEKYGRNKIVVAGGVAANSTIRENFMIEAKKCGKQVFFPPLSLCGDNASMIGAQAYYEYCCGTTAEMNLNAYATMPVDKLL